MFLKWMVMFVAGLIFGGATAAGVIALLTTLGFVSRMIARLQLAKDTLHWENVIILGSLSGCLLSVFEPTQVFFSFWDGMAGQGFAKGLGLIALVLVGICAGIYVGCQAMTLAEILNMFPILFRRVKLQMGLSYAILAIALGKLAGSLWYFIFLYASS